MSTFGGGYKFDSGIRVVANSGATAVLVIPANKFAILSAIFGSSGGGTFVIDGSTVPFASTNNGIQTGGGVYCGGDITVTFIDSTGGTATIIGTMFSN